MIMITAGIIAEFSDTFILLTLRYGLEGLPFPKGISLADFNASLAAVCVESRRENERQSMESYWGYLDGDGRRRALKDTK